MKKNKILAGISALVMGATMMAGTAMSSSAATTANIYPLALKNNSTTSISMVQKAFTGSAANYSGNTLTIPVQKFNHLGGTGYLKTITLYKDDDGVSGYSSGDTVYGVGEVTPELSSSVTTSTLVFNNMSSTNYAIVQNNIVDAYVTYDVVLPLNITSHNHNELDFTLHSSFLTYPNTSVNLDGKAHI